MSPRYHILQLRADLDRESFDCGEPSLNDFLKRHARQNQEKDLGRTFVAVLADDPKIYSYYTLASGSVRFDTLPQKLPRYPIPVIHLGRLAVDRAAKGQGLGKILLLDALARSAGIADQLGTYAIEVYALNQEAKNFYLKYGFTAMLDDEYHLYLSMKDVRKLGLV